jgi:hypothetical protein
MIENDRDTIPNWVPLAYEARREANLGLFTWVWQTLLQLICFESIPADSLSR